MAGGRYFADPPHTLGEGEEEENEEIGRKFLVAFGCTTGWIRTIRFRSRQCPEICTQASLPTRGSHPETKGDYFHIRSEMYFSLGPL